MHEERGGFLDALGPAVRELVVAHGIDQLSPLIDDRPALLRRLQRQVGIARLADRQAVANLLSRARKTGLIVPTPAPLPLPEVSSIYNAAVVALTRWRAVLAARRSEEERVELVCSTRAVQCEEERALILDEQTPVDSADDDSVCLGGLMQRINPSSLCRLLEALELPPAHCHRLRDSLELGWGLRVAFYASQLSERGTEVALFDYAHYAEAVLGVRAYILFDAVCTANVPAVCERFAQRFGQRCIGIDYEIRLDPMLADGGILRRERITHLYMLKTGDASSAPRIDGLAGHVHVCVHAVFDGREPHGDAYARISPCVPGRCQLVPHIVRERVRVGVDLRRQLGIPPDAAVFGRHGALHTFDIPFVREAVEEVARARPRSTFFVLLNTAPFAGCSDLSNVIHLDAVVDDEAKDTFIRTCDAMLHARSRGETFGLAIAEFAMHDKPIITSSMHHDGGLARFHLDLLGERALLYTDRASLIELLLAFDRDAVRRREPNYYAAPYRPFEPHRVMATFRKTFLLKGSAVVEGPRRPAMDGAGSAQRACTPHSSATPASEAPAATTDAGDGVDSTTAPHSHSDGGAADTRRTTRGDSGAASAACGARRDGA